MSEEQKPVPAKTVFDFDKLSLGTSDGPGKLRFGVYNNNPRVIVYTNDKNDKADNGRITAALDPFVFNQLTTLITRVANSTDPVEFSIENKGYEYRNGERDKEMTVLTTLRIGKDSNGVIWIMVEKLNRPKIRFDFGYNVYHTICHADGSPLSQADASKLGALATAKTLENIYNTYLAAKYEHVTPPPRQNNGGYNKGGNNNYRNNSGGYNRSNNSGGGYNRNNNNSGGGYNRSNNSGGGYSSPSNSEISDEDIGF